MTPAAALAAFAVALATLAGSTSPALPGLAASAPEASYDARAPWVAAPRQPSVSQAHFVAALDQLHRSPPSIVFVGDSIVENWLTFGRTIWDADYAPRGAANLGFGGDRTENTLWRIDQGELDGIAPRVTLLEIGTNDLGRWSPSEVVIGIGAVVRAIRAKLPQTEIVVLAILPRDGTATGYFRRRARAVNAMLADTAFGPFARYADIGSVLLATNGTLLPDVMSDGTLHPSLAGYARLAPEIDRLIAAP